MLKSYYTVNMEGSDEIITQKSRFIGYVKRVETEEAAQVFINRIKKKHHDATHNCSAYIIGENDEYQKANDDGEPSGTAGVPILEVLKKKHLKDTAIVVTRYFGGVKLGAGGLIRAYSSTTSQAIATTGIVNRQLVSGFSILADYTLLGKLENAIRNTSYILDQINYLDKVDLSVYVGSEDIDEFHRWIIDLTNDQVTVTAKDTKYIEIPI